MKSEVTLDLLFEMAQCIHCCNWESEDEIYAYMKACVTGSSDYDPVVWDDKKKKQALEVLVSKMQILSNQPSNND